MALQPGTTWSDILESIHAAKTTYLDKAEKKNEGSLPKNRAIITTLDLLTAMIPEENGLSVLKGGLGLVFKARRRPEDLHTTNLNRLSNVFSFPHSS
jgi:hypothetical protein